jgi:hypothetical protein
VPGNHDNRIAREVLSATRAGHEAPLGIAEQFAPPPGTLAACIGADLGCKLTVAYPGYHLTPPMPRRSG